MTSSTETADAIIVGAGLAGLACARRLVDRGQAPVVCERSSGLGGRCATRRIQGQPVDHGAAFLHGSDSGFIAAFRGVSGATVVDGWPRTIDGRGTPCLPKAFTPREERLAYEGGLTALPKHLAQGLDVRLGTPVRALAGAEGGVIATTEDGAAMRARTVVLAVPPPTAIKLMAGLAQCGRDVESLKALLGMIGSQACLTAIAGYAPGEGRPAWDMVFPEDSASVQAISHDSSKRANPRFVALVIQGRPCWSRTHIDAPEAVWAAELIREAARIAGPWASRPLWVQTHRWRFARSDRGSELSRPLSLRIPGGGRVVVTGESFAPGGGIEASWLAGNAAATRILEEE